MLPIMILSYDMVDAVRVFLFQTVLLLRGGVGEVIQIVGMIPTSPNSIWKVKSCGNADMAAVFQIIATIDSDD